ncbi:MAG: ABC transporter permease, partial [Helicobacter sp.]|nr:ABC transporter permease [Helicobacter sp.]
MAKDSTLHKGIVPFIVRRYLRFDREQPFISITAILAFVGVAVGVMVLIVAMAIMNGFDKEFQRKLFVMNYPLTIYPTAYRGISHEMLLALEKQFPDLFFSPFLRSNAISRSGNFMEGAVVFGVDFERERRINSVIDAALQQTPNNRIEGKFDAVIGEGLAYSFGLDSSSSLMLIFTHIQPSGLNLTPIIKRFQTKAFFNSGLTAYDKGYVFLTIDALRLIKQTPDSVYAGIRIYTQNARGDLQRVQDALP